MAFFIEYFLPFIVALTILVFIHELGHYLPARRFGVKVEVFSIGFGPEIFGFTDKAGTRWKFSLVPLGGYVRMFGDANAASAPDADAHSKMNEAEKKLTLQSKTPLQRSIISFGGPFANFLFAFIAMAFIFSLKGVPVQEALIETVVPDSLAANIGFKDGDNIISFNDEPIHSFRDIREKVRPFSGDKMVFQVKRASEKDPVTLSMTKPEGFTPPITLGLKPALPRFEPASPVSAIKHAFLNIYEMCESIIQTLAQVFSGQSKASELGGIIVIGDMAGKSAQSSWISFMMFLAVLSVNLGLLNLFPLPMLDGGHIVFYTIEGVIGRPVPLKVQEYIYLVGFAVLVSFMLYVTWNDLMRYKVIQNITALFS